MVHRAVGRPGVVLVGEGSPTRLASLLAAEKKRVARVAYEVPDHRVPGRRRGGPDPAGQAAAHGHAVAAEPQARRDQRPNHRLKALQPSLQAPKGPMPRNIRQPKMPRPKIASHAGRADRLAPSAAGPGGQMRTTIVSEARSCRPRRSRSVSSGGTTVSRISGPDQRPAEADLAAAETDHADADQSFAHACSRPARSGCRPRPRRRRSSRTGDLVSQYAMTMLQQPVDEQRRDAARHAGHRPRAALGQSEVLAGIASVFFEVAWPASGQPGRSAARCPSARCRLAASGRGGSSRGASRSGSAAAVTGLLGHLTTVSVPSPDARSGPRHDQSGRAAPGSVIMGP